MSTKSIPTCPDCGHEGKYHAWPGCIFPMKRKIMPGLAADTCGCTGLNWVPDREVRKALKGLRDSPISKRMKAAAERRRQVDQGQVAVDTGMILCIDPCLLFNRREWVKICGQEDIAAAVVEGLRKKLKLKALNAACFNTQHGDGIFPVRRTEEGVMIQGA